MAKGMAAVVTDPLLHRPALVRRCDREGWCCSVSWIHVSCCKVQAWNRLGICPGQAGWSWAGGLAVWSSLLQRLAVWGGLLGASAALCVCVCVCVRGTWGGGAGVGRSRHACIMHQQRMRGTWPAVVVADAAAIKHCHSWPGAPLMFADHRPHAGSCGLQDSSALYNVWLG